MHSLFYLYHVEAVVGIRGGFNGFLGKLTILQYMISTRFYCNTPQYSIFLNLFQLNDDVRDDDYDIYDI